MHKLYQVEQARDLLQVSRTTVMRLARKYDAVRKIGSRNVRIDVQRIMDCLEKGE